MDLKLVHGVEEVEGSRWDIILGNALFVAEPVECIETYKSGMIADCVCHRMKGFATLRPNSAFR